MRGRRRGSFRSPLPSSRIDEARGTALCAIRSSRYQAAPRPARSFLMIGCRNVPRAFFGSGRPGQPPRHLQERPGRAMTGGDFRDHLAVVGGIAEHFRVERNGGDRLALDRLGERAQLDFRPLRHADLVEAVQRRPIVGPRRLQHVHHVLGVAHVGEIGLGDDENVVRADQRAPRPRRPLMGNVQHDARRGHAQRIEDRVERVGAEIVDLIQRRRRRQQAEMVGAFREQPLHVGAVQPFGRVTPRWRCPAAGPDCSRGRRCRRRGRDRSRRSRARDRARSPRPCYARRWRRRRRPLRPSRRSCGRR